MSEDEKLLNLYWFAGLFEGEGTFHFVKEKPHSLSITMTDLDVLEKVQRLYGGSICLLKKRKQHWKDAWKWSLYGQNAVSLARGIKPLLMERRASRCRQFIERFSTQEDRRQSRREDLIAKQETALAMRAEGATHREIAEALGVDRTHVTHLLGKRHRHLRSA